jgi:hypothetical protein
MTNTDCLVELRRWANIGDLTNDQREYLLRVMGVVDDEVYPFVLGMIELAYARGLSEE